MNRFWGFEFLRLRAISFHPTHPPHLGWSLVSATSSVDMLILAHIFGSRFLVSSMSFINSICSFLLSFSVFSLVLIFTLRDIKYARMNRWIAEDCVEAQRPIWRRRLQWGDYRDECKCDDTKLTDQIQRIWFCIQSLYQS